MDFFTFDDEVVRRLRAGDPVVSDQFFRDSRTRLGRKFRAGGVRPGQEVEDLIQKVFMAVFAALAADKGPNDNRKFGAWVNGIAENMLREWYRSRRTTESIDESAHDRPSGDDDAVTRLILREERDAVQRALDALGERDASVLRAVILEERDKDEVCSGMGVTRDYLRVLLHRALKQFRDEYRRGR